MLNVREQPTLEAHILRELVVSPREVAMKWLNYLGVKSNQDRQYLGTYVDERIAEDVQVFLTKNGKFEIVYGSI